MKRAVVAAVATVAALLAIGLLAWTLSPWPKSLLIRAAFEAEASRTAAALWAHVPEGIDARHDMAYDPDDPDALLDLYRPAGTPVEQALPVVVWIHGGAFISGRRADVAPYLKILAAEGFATVAVGYSLAPGTRYPRPLAQVNTALGWLQDNAATLGLDTSRVVLAGDSAGAQLAAQIALLATDPAYARQVGIEPLIDASRIRATVLACGALDLSLVDPDASDAGAAFMRTVTWAYSGRRDFRTDPAFGLMSVAEHAGTGFPPTFITAGNADPLLPHSRSMERRLRSFDVEVETLFFPDDHQPPLPHEYQFNLDTDAGRLALERIVDFIQRHTAGIDPDGPPRPSGPH